MSVQLRSYSTSNAFFEVQSFIEKDRLCRFKQVFYLKRYSARLALTLVRVRVAHYYSGQDDTQSDGSKVDHKRCCSLHEFTVFDTVNDCQTLLLIDIFLYNCIGRTESNCWTVKDMTKSWSSIERPFDDQRKETKIEKSSLSMEYSLMCCMFPKSIKASRLTASCYSVPRSQMDYEKTNTLFVVMKTTSSGDKEDGGTYWFDQQSVKIDVGSVSTRKSKVVWTLSKRRGEERSLMNG